MRFSTGREALFMTWATKSATITMTVGLRAFCSGVRGVIKLMINVKDVVVDGVATVQNWKIIKYIRLFLKASLSGLC